MGFIVYQNFDQQYQQQIFAMLIGHRDGQNQKQIKLKKSKIYKQILDKQILNNLRYKQENNDRHHREDQNQFIDNYYNDSNAAPIIQQQIKDNPQLDHSYVHVQNNHQKINNKHFYLPTLKDKNTYYKGHSTFIKLKQPQKTTVKKLVNIKTQPIDQESDDQYHSNCQRIIRELQNINKEQPKNRSRYQRKRHEYSELADHKRNQDREKVKTLESQDRFVNSFDYKVPSLIHFDKKKLDQQKKQHIYTESNDQTGFSKGKNHQKPLNTANDQVLKPKSYSENPKEAASNIHKRQINQFSQDMNLSPATITKNPKLQPISNMNKSSTNKKSEVQQNKVSTQKPPYKQDLNDREKEQKRKEQQKSRPVQQNEELKSNRQLNSKQSQEAINNDRKNFIQLLRNVKNRGESLFMKFSKQPNGKKAQDGTAS